MRLLFLILLLANVTAFAYVLYAENRGGADAQIPLLQINPEKLKVLKTTTPPSTQGNDKAAALSPACLEWGSFAAADAVRAAAALAALEIGDKVSQRDSGGDSYWVYIPPFKARVEAEKKAGEIKSLGITDFYIVQDSDPWRLAIALGAFKSEEAANTYLAQVRQKGVRSAIVGAHGATNSVFLVRDPGDAIASKIAALKADFPAATLRATPCPSSAQATKAP